MNTPIDMNCLYHKTLCIAINYDNIIVEKDKDFYEYEHIAIVEHINDAVRYFSDNGATIVHKRLINLLTSWAINNRQLDIIKYLITQENFNKEEARKVAYVEFLFAREDGRGTDEIEKIHDLLKQ